MMTLAESRKRVALFNAIQDAKNDLERAEHEYLRACGWSYTSDTPGCLWLWVKKCPPPRRPAKDKPVDQRVMMLSQGTAFAMQRHWDDIELDDRAFEDVA